MAKISTVEIRNPRPRRQHGLEAFLEFERGLPRAGGRQLRWTQELSFGADLTVARVVRTARWSCTQQGRRRVETTPKPARWTSTDARPGNPQDRSGVGLVEDAAGDADSRARRRPARV